MSLLFERDPARTGDLYDPDSSDLVKRVANAIRLGAVTDTDYPNARVKVTIGDLVTDWLPWITHRAGPDTTWWAPELLEQVVVFAPSGNLTQAVILGSLYQDLYPAPEQRETIHYTRYKDGTIVYYDRKNHILYVHSMGDVDVQAEGNANVRVKGNVYMQVDGDLHQTIGGRWLVAAQDIEFKSDTCVNKAPWEANVPLPPANPQTPSTPSFPPEA